MPEAAVATPPAAAPAPAASAAPAVPVSTPATSTPTTPTTTPAVTHDAGQVPTAETTPTTGTETTGAGAGEGTGTGSGTGRPEPKREDFDDIEEFLKEHYKWENEQEGGAAAEEPTQTAEPAKEDEQQELPEPEESLTPETLTTLLEGKPELKAAIEADPKVKGAFYQMARENAKLKPLGELFTSVEGAKRMAEVATRTSAIKQAFMMAAEDPAKASDAFEMFLDEFIERDAQGNVVKDAQGNPKIGEDYDVFMNYALDKYIDGELSVVEERLKADKYTNDDARANDQAFVEAVKYIRNFKNATEADLERPDLSGMTPEARAYLEKREKELKEKEEALGLKRAETSREARKAARQQYETKYRTTFGADVGKRLTALVEEKAKANIYIPSYVLETIDPTLKVSVFAKSVFDKFNQKIASIPEVKHRFAELEMRPPSEANLQERITYSRSLIDQYLPGIVDAEIRLVQGKDKSDRAARGQNVDAARRTVEPEPRGGSAPRPTHMTEEEAYAEALRRVDKSAGGQYLDPAERIQKALIEKNRILGQ